MKNDRILISVFEDGETWTAGPVFTISCTKEEFKSIDNGEKPRHVIKAERWKKARKYKEHNIDPFSLPYPETGSNEP